MTEDVFDSDIAILGHILGRTCREDTAFISYLGARLTKNPEESLKFSTVLTPLKLESFRPFNLTLLEVDNLIEAQF